MEELKSLSLLNDAMFEHVFEGGAIKKELFSRRFDRTDPEADRCTVTRAWDARIEGDFYVIKQLGHFLYVIVGDATGHHAYAGALKVFIASSLQRILQGRPTRPPSAKRVLSQLNDQFQAVGLAAIRSGPEPLRDGADVLVLRMDPHKDEIHYASAGLPFYGLGKAGTQRYSQFSDTRSISFPEDESGGPPFRPDTGRLRMSDHPYCVVVTDGFRGMARRVGEDAADQTETYGDARVEAALAKAYSALGAGPNRERCDRIAEGLVEDARAFRMDHEISDAHDDDRLVLVVDLEQLIAAAHPDGPSD